MSFRAPEEVVKLVGAKLRSDARMGALTWSLTMHIAWLMADQIIPPGLVRCARLVIGKYTTARMTHLSTRAFGAA
jgi:hypothetical protein